MRLREEAEQLRLVEIMSCDIFLQVIEKARLKSFELLNKQRQAQASTR